MKQRQMISFEDSQAYLPDGIAETSVTIDEGRFAENGGPAPAMKLSDRGEIAVGKRGDLVLVDWPEGSAPAVQGTWVVGRCAYRGVPVASGSPASNGLPAMRFLAEFRFYAVI